MNDPFRRKYATLTDEDNKEMLHVKQVAENLYNLFDYLGNSRELSIAKTKLEESVMWATKHITSK